MAHHGTNRALARFSLVYVLSVIVYVSYTCLWPDFQRQPLFHTEKKYSPLPFNLTRNHWARVDENTSFFSAYFDNRTKSTPSLILMGAHRGFHYPLYCQPFYNGGVKTCSPVTLSYFVGSLSVSHTHFKTYRYVCPLRRTDSPLFVQIFNRSSCITSLGYSPVISVSAERPQARKQFGLCVGSPLFRAKGFEEVVGAIESNRVLGSEWFTIYIQDAGINAIPALKVYEDLGLGEVIDTWADVSAPSPWFYNGQILANNDCLYRNMFRVEYLVVTDLDELIVPAKSLSWNDMMKTIDSDSFGAFMFRHLTYIPPKNFDITMLVGRNLSTCDDGHKLLLPRSLEYNRKGAVILRYFRRTKHILKPRFASCIGVHHVRTFLPRNLQDCMVPDSVGLLHHYRRRRAYVEDAPHTPDRAFDAVAKKLMRNIRGMICDKMHKFL